MVTRTWAPGNAGGAERAERRAPAVLAPHRAASLLPIALFAVTFIAFAPALWNGFVEWDDPALITSNEAYRGLGWPQISWMFSNVLMGHYVPVTWLSLGLDYVLWGMWPGGYHLTSVLIHAVNAALFFFVARALLIRATSFPASTLHVAAAVGALFFAIHPLRVESVAWVTERRDVLSGLFFFVTLLLYLRAADAVRGRRVALHLLACASYVLAILSKSMVMTLPAVLVLLDVYPLGRLPASPRAWTSAPAMRVWREKVPYAVLGVIAAMLGAYGQAANQYFTSLRQVPWTARPSLVLYSTWFYVSKTALPLGLGPLYELPLHVSPFAARFLVPAVAVLGVTAGAIALRRRWPAGLAVWVGYLAMIAPVTGIVHAGHQLAHDRYSYLPALGFALLVGAGMGSLVELARRGAVTPLIAKAAVCVMVVWLLGLGVLAWQQTEAWRDNDTLWTHAVEANPDCSVCELNLGVSLLNQNALPGARAYLEHALDQRPDRVKIGKNLGLVYARLGDLPRAVEHFQKVVEHKPDDVAALMNLGVALMKQRRHADGVKYLQTAMLLRPDDYLVLSNLAVAFTETGKAVAAVGLLTRAAALRPEAVEPRQGLLLAHLMLGNGLAATTAHQAIAALEPDRAKFLGPLLLESW